MAKVSVLLDTDIFIDYFNTQRFRSLFDPRQFTVYYSIVTKKELLSKPGLRDNERQAIVDELARCRIIPLNDVIASKYSELRHRYPTLHKEDALIAASALVKNLPLLTQNWKHFKGIQGLAFFPVAKQGTTKRKGR